jgi:hypothetical protein
MENRVSVVPAACEAWTNRVPWSRGCKAWTRHGKQGFRGPGGVRCNGKQGFRGPGDVRGMENRVSMVPGNKKFEKKQTQGEKVWSGRNPQICFPSHTLASRQVTKPGKRQNTARPKVDHIPPREHHPARLPERLRGEFGLGEFDFFRIFFWDVRGNGNRVSVVAGVRGNGKQGFRGPGGVRCNGKQCFRGPPRARAGPRSSTCTDFPALCFICPACVRNVGVPKSQEFILDRRLWTDDSGPTTLDRRLFSLTATDYT